MTKSDCSFTLWDLNHDCLNEIFKRLNSCDFLLFTLTAKSIALYPLLAARNINHLDITVEASREGSIEVMNYLLTKLGYQYGYDCLREANPSKINCFSWLVDVVYPCDDFDSYQLVEVYAMFACKSRVFEAVKSAFMAVEKKLSEVRFERTYVYSIENVAFKVKHFSIEPILQIYNAWIEISPKTLVGHLMPKEYYINIDKIIALDSLSTCIGEKNLVNIVKINEEKQLLFSNSYWKNIAVYALVYCHFSLVNYLLLKGYCSKDQIIALYPGRNIIYLFKKVQDFVESLKS